MHFLISEMANDWKQGLFGCFGETGICEYNSRKSSVDMAVKVVAASAVDPALLRRQLMIWANLGSCTASSDYFSLASLLFL